MEVSWFSTPKKPQQSCSKIKTMLTVFFDWEDVVHHEYVPSGQTINKEYYLNVLHWLRDAIRWKRLQLWATGDWQLHHANALTHASCLAQGFLAKHQITQVTQPLCSPDLVSWNFWPFPKLKSPLKGKKFQTIDEIQENTMGQLMVIPTKDFVEYLEQWKKCRENFVRSQVAYFEGDWGVIVLCTVFLVSFSTNVSFSYHITGYFLDVPFQVFTEDLGVYTLWMRGNYCTCR